MEKKTRTILAIGIIAAVIVVGFVLFFVVFQDQDENSKFLGTWDVIENPAGITGGTTTFYKNGLFTASDGTSLVWEITEGKLCIEDPLGGLSGPLTACMDYEFFDNNNRLTLKYDGEVVMKLSKS